MIFLSNFISAIMNFYIAYNLFSYVLVKPAINKRLQLLIFAVACIFDALASVYADKSNFFLPLIMLTTIFIVSMTFKGQLFIKFMLSILMTVIIALCEIFTGMIIVSLTHLDMSTIISANHTLYLFGVLLSNVLGLFTVKLIGYIKHARQVKLSVTLLIGLFFTSFASLCPIYIITKFSYEIVGLPNTITVIVVSVLLILSNFFLFHFFEVQLVHEQQKIEYKFMSRQIKVQADYYKSLIEEHQTINKTTHDIKNNLLAIEGCILGNDVQGAVKRINEICMNLNDKTKIYTSNITVDTILNAKEKEARNSGADLQIISSSFEDIKVDAIDLGVILGNALDNAIEACKKIPNDNAKTIFAKILHIEDYISIVVENTVDKPVHIVDGMVASTKNNSFHGYGIKNIKAVVEKYDGDVQLHYEANKFSINMLLKST
jgi:hypothetical protein